MNNLPTPLVDLDNFKPNCEALNFDGNVIGAFIYMCTKEGEAHIMDSEGLVLTHLESMVRPLPTPQPWDIYKIMAWQGGFRHKDVRDSLYSLVRIYKYGKSWTIKFGTDSCTLDFFLRNFLAVDAAGVDHDMRGGE